MSRAGGRDWQRNTAGGNRTRFSLLATSGHLSELPSGHHLRDMRAGDRFGVCGVSLQQRVAVWPAARGVGLSVALSPVVLSEPHSRGAHCLRGVVGASMRWTAARAFNSRSLERTRTKPFLRQPCLSPAIQAAQRRHLELYGGALQRLVGKG